MIKRLMSLCIERTKKNEITWNAHLSSTNNIKSFNTYVMDKNFWFDIGIYKVKQVYYIDAKYCDEDKNFYDMYEAYAITPTPNDKEMYDGMEFLVELIEQSKNTLY